MTIAVPPSRRLQLRGVVPRRVEGVWSVENGIPTHAPEHLLLDIVATGDDELLEWAWRQAIYRRDLDHRAVGLLLGARPGAPGTRALRKLHEKRGRAIGELRTRFELVMLSIAREAGLPEPLCNVRWEVAPGVWLRPDLRWPQLRLVVEADGRDGHADVEQVLGDEERDLLYRANRHTCLRFSSWQATRERSRVVARLAQWRLEVA